MAHQPPLHLGRLSLSTFWPSFSHLRNEEIGTGSVLSKPLGICIRIVFTKTKKIKNKKNKTTTEGLFPTPCVIEALIWDSF